MNNDGYCCFVSNPWEACSEWLHDPAGMAAEVFVTKISSDRLADAGAILAAEGSVAEVCEYTDTDAEPLRPALVEAVRDLAEHPARQVFGTLTVHQAAVPFLLMEHQDAFILRLTLWPEAVMRTGEDEAEWSRRFNAVVDLAGRICRAVGGAAVIISEETAAFPDADRATEPACRACTVWLRYDLMKSKPTEE